MFINFKNWFKQYWHRVILVIVALAFFIGTSSFNYITQKNDFVKWLSPDESANYNFAKLYAQEGKLQIFEKYNLAAGGIIHPRSYLSDAGWLKPVSFLGLILIYGKIAALTSCQILPYLTPLFAAIGIVFFYLLIKLVFGRRHALISALLLASFPPYIYYSARSMFHNVLFTALAIIGFYFAAAMGKKGKPAYITDISAGLAGAFFGLAVIARASELIWLIPVWLILWLFNFKKAGLIKPLIFIACFLFALLPAAYWNKILYQSYWQGGYGEMNQSIINLAGAGTEIIKAGLVKASVMKDSLAVIKNNFFHFGFWPVKSLKMLYYYFAQMFYWLFWPAVLGFLLLLANIKKWKKKHYAYLASYFVLAVILLFYYGSWDFHDNPDPKSHTIGNSYTRYWLPIYLGVMPLTAIFLLKLTEILRKKALIYLSRVFIIAVIFFISLNFVLFSGDEALVKTAKNQLAVRAERDQVLNLTEGRSVIITRYHDKLLFPERKVIVGLFDNDDMLKNYAALVKYLPVYYYNFTFPEKDINFLNNLRLPQFDLQIKSVAQVTKDFTLYRLENVK